MQFRNEHIKIATNHLELAKEEASQCAQSLFEKLEKLQNMDDEASQQQLISQMMATLQLQDIITQRLDKIEQFLTTLDKDVDIERNSSFLDDFAWENEVDQDDIDQMFNEYKG